MESATPGVGADDGLTYSASQGTGSGVQDNDTSAILGFFVNNFFYEVWVLFKDLDIPQGSTIDSCTIDWIPANDYSGGTLEIWHGFHNTDNGARITTTGGWDTAYANQTAKIGEALATTNGVTKTTPELKAALQEIIDRVGFTSGNDVLYLMTVKARSGQEWVQPYMYDFSAGANRMVMNVEFTEGGGDEVVTRRLTLMGVGQ